MTDARISALRARFAAMLAAGLTFPTAAVSQSLEELQIRQWRETYEQTAWTPEANAVLDAKGNRAGINFSCTAFSGNSVGIVVKRSKKSKHPVSAYRGQSGAYCAPKGVGLIEFADGGRWLGEISNHFSLWKLYSLPYPDGLGELRKADGSSQILRVKANEKDPYGWQVVQVVSSTSTTVAGDAGATRPVAWLNRPAPADWARLQPAAGQGRVVLACTIAANGGVDCLIAESVTPELDAAALALSRLFKVDMAAEKDRVGYSFKLPFRFDPPAPDGGS
ncbi:energy transducer TonB family protein [Caulobacter sp. NIBR2454]|uniref:energy transducer TonB family protein n=1 Tax=Caulobacter sp. NIBR2454 TaxID=3015996 RepID=UPI0022B5E850|nr:energy transducer TonB [Caulobacter sp. NIBR2454]